MSELYELPSGWRWAKLKDVCDLLNGYAFKAKEYVEYSDTVIIRMGNIRPNGGFDAEHKIKYLPSKYKDELPNYILNDGDLIIAMTDLATEMRILGNPTLVSNTNGRVFMLNQRVGKLHKFDFEKIIIEYLRYILSASQIKEYYKSLGGGGLQINIGKQQILSVDFPLPPLPEQLRIVSKLDLLFLKIDKAIDLHQKNIDNADLFMGSVLNDVFTELEEKYEKNYLSNYCQITSSKRVYKADYVDSGVLFYRIKDIVLMSKKLPITDSQYIKREAFDEFNKKFGSPKSGDILLTAVGATLGYTYLVTDKDGKFYFKDGNILWLKNINELNRKFLLYIFQSPLFEKYLGEISKGAAQPAITIIKLKEFNIPLPPLHIQQKTVKYLDEISQKTERVKELQKEKLQSLKALKASILDRAFRGEL